MPMPCTVQLVSLYSKTLRYVDDRCKTRKLTLLKWILYTHLQHQMYYDLNKWEYHPSPWLNLNGDFGDQTKSPQGLQCYHFSRDWNDKVLNHWRCCGASMADGAASASSGRLPTMPSSSLESHAKLRTHRPHALMRCKEWRHRVAENMWSMSTIHYCQIMPSIKWNTQMSERRLFVANAAQVYIRKKAESTHHVCSMEPVENWPQGPYQSVEIGWWTRSQRSGSSNGRSALHGPAGTLNLIYKHYRSGFLAKQRLCWFGSISCSI